MYLEAELPEIEIDTEQVKDAVQNVVGEEATDAAVKATRSVMDVMEAHPWIKPVCSVLVILLVAKLIMSLVNHAIRKANLEKTTQHYLHAILRVLIYGAAALSIAGTLGLNITSLVALFSVAGAAFALAAQDTLSNVFAGLMLLMSKPLKVGEYVALGGAGVEGTVLEVNLMHTRLVTPDNRLVVVPNSSIVGNTVTNNTRGGKRRIDLNFSISYDADIEETKLILLRTMNKNSMVLDDPEPPFARVTSYSDSAVIYTARFWVSNDNYWNVQFDLLEDIKKALDSAGIEMTYNHLNVHLDSNLPQQLKS